MNEERFAQASVIGTGMMGPGIALVLARVSSHVAIVGRSAASLQRAQDRLDTALDFLVHHQLRTPDEARTLRERVWLTDRLEDATDRTGLVVESISEDLAAKRALFARLEALCGAQTLLTSNTSGLRISEITAGLAHPERAATTHFWNPPHLIPLVEVTQGERTSPETVESLVSLLRQCGQAPVVARKDVPGQIANRLQHALLREALSLVQEGIASAADVDLALKLGPGRRWPVYGVLEHQDVVGLDLTRAVQQALAPDLCTAPAPLPILEDLVRQGHLGISTGQGFYDWTARDATALIALRDAFLSMLARDWPMR